MLFGESAGGAATGMYQSTLKCVYLINLGLIMIEKMRTSTSQKTILSFALPFSNLALLPLAMTIFSEAESPRNPDG